MRMTVGQLKKHFQGLEDETEIVFCDVAHDEMFSDINQYEDMSDTDEEGFGTFKLRVKLSY